MSAAHATLSQRATQGTGSVDSVQILKGLLPKYEALVETPANATEPDTDNVTRFLTLHETSVSLDETQFQAEEARFSRLRLLVVESQAKLMPVSAYLARFERGLRDMSKQMEDLQSRSNSLSQSLESAKSLEVRLGPIIADISVPPELIKEITLGTVNTAWVENIRIVAEKSEILRQHDDSAALREARAVLERLTLKIVERVRDFYIRQIRFLRRGTVLSQVVQKRLLDMREAYTFLYVHHEALALELRQAYVFTMRWYYKAHFTSYLHSLQKLKIHAVDASTLLGSDDGSDVRAKSFFGAAKRPQGLSGMDYVTLGKRAGILSSADHTVLLAQIAENNPMTYWMETGFRSFNLAVVDNGTVEYLFMADFFQPVSTEALEGLFGTVFQPTFQLGALYTRELLESHDAYGILLCIRVCQALERELQSRRVPVMENYLNLQMITLWPRFQQIIDQHCESMRRAATRAALAPLSVVPHRLTQQFALFLLGLTKLAIEHAVEPLSNSVTRLRNDFEAVLTKILAGFGRASNKEMFLFNNYFLILTVLNDAEGALAAEQCEHFKMLTDAYTPGAR
ncbi:hypothetical protein BABINDRAFT_162678 [Babjeviella inositovora NRRL Y-12698]|uniref:Vps52/Sac2 family protein n=1 Tax=Babjeviella inositovora NRRL Y-12698 TaxID=984486 RepID=A0A1E3QLD6_9ASCO|nr:uncharacterized protein BABINDRAFT_162678 [Babjeviella inositovora NRRL Y-12698]ODQ78460.1 hypothetical protein BABINDRAFT_162678 [Babjeviella inositovora NRRL Y-12698]